MKIGSYSTLSIHHCYASTLAVNPRPWSKPPGRPALADSVGPGATEPRQGRASRPAPIIVALLGPSVSEVTKDDEGNGRVMERVGGRIEPAYSALERDCCLLYHTVSYTRRSRGPPPRRVVVPGGSRRSSNFHAGCPHSDPTHVLTLRRLPIPGRHDRTQLHGRYSLPAPRGPTVSQEEPMGLRHKCQSGSLSFRAGIGIKQATLAPTTVSRKRRSRRTQKSPGFPRGLDAKGPEGPIKRRNEVDDHVKHPARKDR